MDDQLIKFDSDLKSFYKNFFEHYKSCLKLPNNNINTIYTEMYEVVSNSVELPSARYNKLSAEEKKKIYTAFDFLFRSLPFSEEERKTAVLKKPVLINEYNFFMPPLFCNYEWIDFYDMANDCVNYKDKPYRTDIFQQAKPNESSFNVLRLPTYIALLFLSASTAGLIFVASLCLYYAFKELSNIIERFWHDEGWQRAAMIYTSHLALGFTAVILSSVFVAPATAIIVLLAGLVVRDFAVSTLGGVYNSSDFTGAPLDPSEPYRFGLTVADEERLVNKGIAPISVQCALIALRAAIEKVRKEEEKLPFYSRHGLGLFGRTTEEQVLLEKVRALRKGELNSLQVGDLHFSAQSFRHNNAQQDNPSNAEGVVGLAMS